MTCWVTDLSFLLMMQRLRDRLAADIDNEPDPSQREERQLQLESIAARVEDLRWGRSTSSCSSAAYAGSRAT